MLNTIIGDYAYAEFRLVLSKLTHITLHTYIHTYIRTMYMLQQKLEVSHKDTELLYLKK